MPVTTVVLTEALIAATGDATRVGVGALDRHAAAHDASHFLLTPRAVVTARDAAEVGRLFAVSARHGVPLTLRAGGTSLSGQSVTDGILVDVRKGFRTCRVLDGGARVRTQPGVTRSRAGGLTVEPRRSVARTVTEPARSMVSGVMTSRGSVAPGVSAPSICHW